MKKAKEISIIGVLTIIVAFSVCSINIDGSSTANASSP